MKFLRSRVSKVLLAAAALVLVAALWDFARERDWRSHPDAAFRAITGRDLPAGGEVLVTVGDGEIKLEHPAA